MSDGSPEPQKGWFRRGLVRIFETDDIDRILPYNTARMVTIQDRRLGIMRIVFMLAIIVFVILQLCMNGTYLQAHVVHGTARLDLQQPTLNCTVEQRKHPENYCEKCDPTLKGCYDFFPNVTELEYCSQNKSEYPFEKLPCRFEEAASASAVFQSAMLVATRGYEMFQQKICSAKEHDPLYKNGTCDLVYEIISSDEYYYADIEQFQITVLHSIQSPITRVSHGLEGAIYVEHNHGVCARDKSATTSFPGTHRAYHAPCYIRPNQTRYLKDYFLLGTLLDLVDVSLDDTLFFNSTKTIRGVGMTVVITVEYSNWSPWELLGPGQTKDPRYVYRLSATKNETFKHTQAIYNVYPGNRTLLQRSGVRVVVVQSGVIREFQFVNLLITVTTSLTLITISTVIVDFIALYLMSDSQLYNDYKFLVTPDMSDVRGGVSCASCNHELEEAGEGESCMICTPTDALGRQHYSCPPCGVTRCEECLAKSARKVKKKKRAKKPVSKRTVQDLENDPTCEPLL